jgi:hypothetical protein
MVPALYDEGEKDTLINGVRDEVNARGLPDSKDSCWAFYVDKCRSNLHVVLAMSPVGETLRTRCRNYPGMVNNTVIDWFDPWPEEVSQQDANPTNAAAVLMSLCNVLCLSLSYYEFAIHGYFRKYHNVQPP